MDYYIERLEHELKKIMSFWMKNIIEVNPNSLYSEYSTEGKVNKSAPVGSLFLSRVMYGASAACRFLETQEYKPLAELAFRTLYERFKNPAGGFYWAKTPANEIIHDSENINMAQAFILLGLSEYALLTKNPIVESEMKKQQQFIFITIKDSHQGGYLDGFDINWKQEKQFTKSLATHLHLLEALVKQYEYSKDYILVSSIKELIEIISHKFVDSKNSLCLHSFTPGWEPLPNKNWAGHNAETGWLLCNAARAIDDKELIQLTCQLERQLTDSIITSAFDKNYGGIFNEIGDDGPIKTTKEWWPQAEASIAMFYAYECSKDKTFLSYAIRFIEYIENTFSDNLNYEWYSSVSREGMPDVAVPKVHFWKSIYHNVRYCIEVSNLLKRLVRRD